MEALRPYVWEIAFPQTTTIELDFAVTFEAGVFYRINANWVGGAVFEKMREYLSAGGTATLKDLDGIETPLTQTSLARVYKSLLNMGGKI